MDKNFYYAAFLTLLMVGAFAAPCMAFSYTYAGGVPYYIPSGSNENYYSAYVVDYDYDYDHDYDYDDDDDYNYRYYYDDDYAYSSSGTGYNAYVKPNYKVRYDESNYNYDSDLDYIIDSKITLYDKLWEAENYNSKKLYLTSNTAQRLNDFIDAVEDITGLRYNYIYNHRQNNDIPYNVISNIRINVGKIISIAEDMRRYGINRSLVYDMNTAASDLEEAVKKI